MSVPAGRSGPARSVRLPDRAAPPAVREAPRPPVAGAPLRRRLVAGLRRHGWALALAAAVAGLCAQRLVALDVVPPGLHSDEASVGYNAWAIAHHGADEHGSSFPLFFEAFGEYKNPLYIYLLAPFTWVLPLTAATVRLPAALAGVAVCLLAGATVLRLTSSRAAALLTLVTAALTPWAVLMARVGVEAPAMVLCLAAALWCLSHTAAPGGRRTWAWGAGVALGLGVFSYSSARLLVGALVVAMALADRRWRPGRASLPLLLPVTAAYALLAGYAALHPDALVHRLAGISIQSDDPGPVALASRFVRNYLTYTGLPFLGIGGDSNLRYSTGHQGMLPVSSLPIVGLGLAVCIARRREAMPRLILLGLALAPVPAALTNDGTPQSLRAAGMLPFLLVLAGYGWQAALGWLGRHRAAAGVLAVAALVETGSFAVDLYTRYPDRALAAFDTGQVTAITAAHRLAAGHPVLLSTGLDQGYVEALFALRPAPPAEPVHAQPSGDNRAYHDAVLRPLGMAEASPAEMATLASPGDLLVLGPGDRPPPGAREVLQVTVTVTGGEVFGVGAPPRSTVVLASVWRR